MLSFKQGGIKYHILSLCYNSTWDWTPVSWAIDEHSNRSANVRLIDNIIYINTIYIEYRYNIYDKLLLNILYIISLRIHIYIYYHPQTDCFVLSELFNVAKHVGRSKPGSKPIQLYVRLSLRPLGQQAYHVWLREFLRYYVVIAAARVLNSFEELCIMRAAAENSFTRVLNPHGGVYIYIYIYIYNIVTYNIS